MIRLDALRNFGIYVQQCCVQCTKLALSLYLLNWCCHSSDQCHTFLQDAQSYMVETLQSSSSSETNNNGHWWALAAAAFALYSTKQQTQTNKRSDGETSRRAKGASHSNNDSSCNIPKTHISRPSTTTENKNALWLLSQQLPSEVLCHLCDYLHPRDLTTLVCLDRALYHQFSTHHTRTSADSRPAHNVWKQLWYRDYGNMLLQWSVGRRVLQESLQGCPVCSCSIEKKKDTLSQPSLETCLSHHLDHCGLAGGGGMKEFYFVFGETYVNYLCARHNQEGSCNCLMGVHGHILEFGPFSELHPGDSVALECGQDVTHHFEGLPHSRGARAIAQHLAVIVNQGTLTSDTKAPYPRCGLVLQQLPDNLSQILRQSNSRPLQNHSHWGKMKAGDLFPKQPGSPTRRPPTLEHIRRQWDETLIQERAQWVYKARRTSIMPRRQNVYWTASPDWRVYYDPLLCLWKVWNAKQTQCG